MLAKILQHRHFQSHFQKEAEVTLGVLWKNFPALCYSVLLTKVKIFKSLVAI